MAALGFHLVLSGDISLSSMRENCIAACNKYLSQILTSITVMQKMEQFCQALWHLYRSRWDQTLMLKTWRKLFSLNSLQKHSLDFEGCSKLPRPEKKASGKRRGIAQQLSRCAGRWVPVGAFRTNLNSFPFLVQIMGSFVDFYWGFQVFQGKACLQKKTGTCKQ